MVTTNDVPIKAIFGKFTYAYVFFGLIPFDIKEEGGKYTYVASRKAMICAVGNLLAIIALNSLTLLQSTVSPFSKLSSGSEWLDTTPYFLDMCIGPAFILSILIKRKSLFRFCENLLSFDRGGLRIESATTQELKIIAAIWMCFFIFMFIIMMVTTEEDSGMSTVWATSSWGKLVYFLMQFQYIVAVLSLRIRFQRINRYLERASGPDLTKGKVLEMCRLHHHSTRPKILVHEWWNLCLLYEKLQDSASHLNAVFYPMMLMNVLMIFMSITYMAIVIVQCIMVSGEKYQIFIAALIFVCGVAVFIFGMQLYYCHITYTEVERTPTLLHKAFNNSSPDNDNKDMILLFSKQILGRRTKFFSCGLFVLDFPLLYSVTSAISSYIIILVQFQLFS